MALSRLINRPATLLRREATGTDQFGDPMRSVTEIEVLCELQPRRRDESEGRGEVSETLWNVYILPADTEIRHDDGLLVDGVRYEFVGDVWHARNPRTRQLSHIEATVQRGSGGEGS